MRWRHARGQEGVVGGRRADAKNVRRQKYQDVFRHMAMTIYMAARRAHTSSSSKLVSTMTAAPFLHGSSLSPPVVSGLVFVVVVLLQIFFTYSTSLLNDENRRRLQHMTTGQALVSISYLLPLKYCLVLLGSGCSLILYVRFLHDSWYRQHFHSLLRPYELQYGVLPGAFYFLLGVFVVALVFPMQIARYSVLCLSYADPMAAWVGSALFTNFKIHSGASVSGCTACFVTALVVGVITLNVSNVRIPIIGALVCMIAEALPFVNDNVMIPISTASAVRWAMSFE